MTTIARYGPPQGDLLPDVTVPPAADQLDLFTAAELYAAAANIFDLADARARRDGLHGPQRPAWVNLEIERLAANADPETGELFNRVIQGRDVPRALLEQVVDPDQAPCARLVTHRHKNGAMVTREVRCKRSSCSTCRPEWETDLTSRFAAGLPSKTWLVRTNRGSSRKIAGNILSKGGWSRWVAGEGDELTVLSTVEVDGAELVTTYDTLTRLFAAVPREEQRGRRMHGSSRGHGLRQKREDTAELVGIHEAGQTLSDVTAVAAEAGLAPELFEDGTGFVTRPAAPDSLCVRYFELISGCAIPPVTSHNAERAWQQRLRLHEKERGRAA